MDLRFCVINDQENYVGVDQCFLCAGIAQLVERNLAKVEVASSSLVSRSNLLQ